MGHGRLQNNDSSKRNGVDLNTGELEGGSILNTVYWSVHGSIYVRDTEGQSVVDMSFEVQVARRKTERVAMLLSVCGTSEQGEVRNNSEREMCPKGLGCDE